MLITCPNCHRRFNLRSESLGLDGRQVRCGNCHHVWHQSADLDAIEESMLGVDAPMPAAEPEIPVEEVRAPSFGGMTMGLDEDDLLDIPGGTEAPSEGLVESPEELAKDEAIAAELEKAAPEPIPSVFATAPQPVPAEFEEEREQRGIGFWISVLVVVLIIIFGGLYIFRDSVVATWPQIGRLYELAGIRSLSPGAGLDLKNATAERTGQGGSELLTVKGQVVNTTGNIRPIPTLHLALYANQTMLQDTYADPPRPLLDAKASTDFSITLPQPNPRATRFEVTFAAGKPAGAPAAPPTSASQPTTPPPGPATAPSAASAPSAAAPSAGSAPPAAAAPNADATPAMTPSAPAAPKP